MAEQVAVQTCTPEVSVEEAMSAVKDLVSTAITADAMAKLSRARKVFVKPNLGISTTVTFKNRFTNVVDIDIFQGVVEFLRSNTDAEIIYGDGMGAADINVAMKERGYHEIAERNQIRLVDLDAGPYSRFNVPHPAMFESYFLSSELEDVDFVVSIAKMKSHHLCGVTLTLKNLFGIPPTPVYGSPRFALHSTVRLPRLLIDLSRLFPPDLCIVDGIIGGNFSEWQGDPISSGLLLAGTNCVAVDATAARLMHVDPSAQHGTAPFILADNHIRLASEFDLGPVSEAEINVVGELPERTLPFTCSTVYNEDFVANANTHYKSHCRTARRYFQDMDRHVSSYEGETIVLLGDEVILRSPLDSGYFGKYMSAVEKAGAGIYEVFTKLVEREDVELQAPYMDPLD